MVSKSTIWPTWIQGKKGGKYNKKDGVEFKMMFRHHKDPLYYDTSANAKIFVPVTEGLTEEK